MSGAGSPEVRVALTLPDDWPSSGDGDVGVVAAQLPEARALEAGTRVVVAGEAVDRKPGVIGRVLGRRARRASRAVRATALLARGYVRIEAERGEVRDGDVWGYA